MFLILMIPFETLMYTLGIQFFASRDSLYTKALVPKFIAIAALFVSLFRYTFESYWWSNAAAFIIYVAFMRKPLRISPARSIPIVLGGQLIYNFILWFFID